MPKFSLRSVAAGAFVAGAVAAGLTVALLGPKLTQEPAQEPAVATSTAPAAASPADVEAIERVVHDYLLRQPEVILEAIEVLETRTAQQAAETQRRTITERRDELVDDPAAPVGGNPDGTVTVVEFFDYQCPYCKSVAAPLLETVEGQGDVRIVFKELPILGPVSDFAAKAALAANRQGGYLDFHLALMTARGKLSEALVLDLAERSGLDMDRLREDMAAPEIAEAIERNQALAGALNIRGTPAFVIGDEVVPGAISMERMRALIDAERSS